MIKIDSASIWITIFGIIVSLLFGGVSRAAEVEGPYTADVVYEQRESSRGVNWLDEGAERAQHKIELSGWLKRSVNFIDRAEATTTKFMKPCVAISGGPVTAQIKSDVGIDIDWKSGQIDEYHVGTRVHLFAKKDLSKECLWSN